MIRLCNSQDIEAIYEIINDAAKAYKGVIPSDCYHEPYMSLKELHNEIENGVIFFGYEKKNELLGVMGLQEKGEVSLIRHAYVTTNQRNSGIGSKLLLHLIESINKPILIGTWDSASWAIRFYQKHGFRVVSEAEKERLLKRYWNVPLRQIETSVVLCDKKWSEKQTKVG
jgi:N-acetylglutamate synthase-like GNAT family acetyltransferase